MQLEQVEKLLEMQDGNLSYFYPILKDRLKVYREDEVPFPQEFLFFEERYLKIKKNMIENNVKQDIVDIGCQFGFQSELFLDSESYLGIDCRQPSHFMNSERDNVSYMIGMFPNTEIDLTGKTVISSMSLGYFNNFLGKDEEAVEDSLVASLADAETIYIATTKRFVEKVATHFDTCEVLAATSHGDFNTYILRK